MWNEVIYNKVRKGKDTGPVSRILSNINILIFTLLLIFLFKSNQYVLLVILLVASFTKASFFVSIIVLVYFFIIKYWIGAILLLLSGSIGALSAWFGFREVNKNLHSNRAKIDPLEGMADVTLLIVLHLILFSLALLTSGVVSIIFWILFVFIILGEILRYYHRLASPWRRIHFPLMIRYSAILGYYKGIGKNADELNIEQILRTLIKGVYPHMDDNEINLLIKSARDKMINLSDKEILEKIFKENNLNLNYDKFNKLMDKIKLSLNDPKERAWYLKYVIAEIIAKEYGEEERIKYIYSLITGKAF